jgi:hypothetical protein
MTINKRAVNTARYCFGVLGKWLRVCGIRGVEKCNAVFAVGGAFSRDDQNLAVRSRADVIDQSRVYLDPVGLFGVGGIRDVKNEKLVRDG